MQLWDGPKFQQVTQGYSLHTTQVNSILQSVINGVLGVCGMRGPCKVTSKGTPTVSRFNSGLLLSMQIHEVCKSEQVEQL